MSTPIAIASFFVIWWITLLAVLPWGVRSQHEGGEIEPGTDPGAPVTHRIWSKLLWTTVVAGIIFGALYYSLESGLFPVDALLRLATPPHQ
jgi:predicted secreted protein